MESVRDGFLTQCRRRARANSANRWESTNPSRETTCVNGYDGFDQLLAFSRGELNGAKDTIATPTRNQTWDLDVMGNWTTVTSGSGGSGTPENRTHNKQNQVTQTGSNTLTFDNNGNTKQFTEGGTKTLTYDAWDRLVSVTVGAATVTYAYDAMGRRVKETSGTPAVTTDVYFSDDWQVLEEKQGFNITAQYVWSPIYVDALILRDDPGAGGVGGGDGFGGDEGEDGIDGGEEKRKGDAAHFDWRDQRGRSSY